MTTAKGRERSNAVGKLGFSLMEKAPLMIKSEGEKAFANRHKVLESLDISAKTYDAVKRAFPVRWPTYYLDLAQSSEEIARMGRPQLQELEADPGDLADPISDMAQRPHPFVVRKHLDRVIILTTKKCHFYCRFCFRRDEPFDAIGEPQTKDWHEIFDFLRANPEIREPILSGGDPLTLSDTKLSWLAEQLTTIPSVTHWRIHSRAPVHFPSRITADLIKVLSTGKPLTLVTHINCAAEVTEETYRVAGMFKKAGIRLKNQAVLLAGVNDSCEAQQALWRAVNDCGIEPYYLHHPDRAPGNAAFRVQIERGRHIYAAMCAAYDGARPAYVLDLPNGRGKIPVMEMEHQDSHLWRYHHPDGRVSAYRDWQ